jgi:hypothetical protein
MSREDERQLSTADLAAGAERRPQPGSFSQAGRMPDADRFDEEALPNAEAGAQHDARSAGSLTPADGQPGAMHQAGSRPAQAEPLAALFQAGTADDFRRRWDAIQIGFVDDPRAAVRNADELVAQVLRSLAESFAEQRSQTDSRLEQGGQGSTEEMRVALQRYRSFFQRLLSL